MSVPEQLGLPDVPTTCPCCQQPWTPEVGDTDVCPECFPSDDRSERAMLDLLGPVPPWTLERAS